MMKVSRRHLLKGGAVGASLLGLNYFIGHQTATAQEAAPSDTLQTLVDLAITGKGVACMHYYKALTSESLQFTASERQFLLAILNTEFKHLHDLVYQHQAQLLTIEYYLPAGIYQDRAGFANVTRQLETAFASAYLAAVRRFAEIGAPHVAASFAQIAIAEGIHLALVRQLEGLLPNDTSRAEPMYYHFSDFAPVLRPFLEGGAGFEGPFPFPNDAIHQLLDSSGVIVSWTDSFNTRYG